MDRDSEYIFIDEVENAIDSLRSAAQILTTSEKFKWKWITISLHHALYSFCVSCQSQGNFENVLSSGRDDEDYFVKIGNEVNFKKPIKIKHRVTPAYRLQWQETVYTDENPPPIKRKKTRHSKKLIGFWTALARVQDQYFWMGRLITIKALKLSDDELDSIVKFTELRNKLVHFVPQAFGFTENGVRDLTKVVLQAIEFLAFESNAIAKYYVNPNLKSSARKAIEHLKIEL